MNPPDQSQFKPLPFTPEHITVLFQYREDGETWLHALCSCGVKFEVRKCSVTSGNTSSCGHIRAELARTKNKRAA